MTALATGTCWNCRQPLQAEAATCLWCGVSQQAPATQFVMAPAGALASAGAAPVPSQAAQAGALAPGSLVAPANHAVGKAADQAVRQRSAVSVFPLPAAFRGTVAGTGSRLAAFTIDVAAVAAVSVAASIVWSSAVLSVITAVEAAVFLWVLEARTGLTVGNAALRVRTSRADAPYSPGVGRALVKNVVIGAGFVGAAVGAWVVVGSSAWTGSRKGRGWADLASRTVSVAVPPRERVAPAAGAVAVPHVIQSTRTSARIEPQVSGLGAARVVSGLAHGSLSGEDSMALSQTGVSPGGGALAIEQTAPPVAVAPLSRVVAAPAIAPAPGIAQPAPSIAPPPGVVAPAPGAAQPVAEPVAEPLVVSAPAAAPTAAPVVAPTAAPVVAPPAAPQPQAAEPATQGTLLLVFDTGQREQIPLPAVVNLGRKPTAVEPTDRLISVNDPEGTVSKNHVRLEHSRGRTWVTDQGSTNGTELLDDDGDVTVVKPGLRTAVDDGSRVRIGNRAFTISVLVDGAQQGGNV